MRIHIKEVAQEGVSIAADLDPKRLKDLEDLQVSENCTFQGMLAVKLRVMPTAGMFQVEGHLIGPVTLACSRCLAPVPWPLKADFRLTFTRSLPGDGMEASPESRELEAEELGVVLFEGDEIDFKDVIQEQVIMALPMQPLCKDECRGLCPQCGANLNDGSCRCSGKDIDPRLAVLKNLKLDR
jgi:uncharacterized protein